MGRQLIAPPTEEPFTVEEAKLHLRVEDDQTEEDELIDVLMKAARVQVENDTGLALLTQTWRYFIDYRFPYTGHYVDAPIILTPAPLQSVTQLRYLDSGGVLTTLGTGNYVVDAASVPGRVLLSYGLPWPMTQYAANAVQVDYVVGWENPSLIPQTLIQAMKLLIGNWYENREAAVVGTSAAPVPLAYEALIAPHRQLAVA